MTILSPDDPRLTAFALGELEADERAAVAEAVAADPALQAAVAEIRALSGRMETALATEAGPEEAMERAGAASGRRGAAPARIAGAAGAGRRRARWYSFPNTVAAALAAACFALAVWLGERRLGQDEAAEGARVYYELSLSAPTGERPTRAPEAVRLEPFAIGAADFDAADAETYAYRPDRGFVAVAAQPWSTFAVGVDSASYATVRRMLRGGIRPPPDAVRVEEFINAFRYDYAPPAAEGDAPLAAHLEVAEAPWAPGHQLVRIGLKARELPPVERPPANLVFLLDVSGSMQAANRLPLVQASLRLLVEQLRPDDRVAIVTYADGSGLALPSTPVARRGEILDAIESLKAGGSTHGSMGIQLAYDIAKANRRHGGVDRVVLCTDGDFNVGMTSEGELVRLIQEKARAGVNLTVLGFGLGNYKDATLEALARHGNGQHGYVDTLREARRLLVEEVDGTLVAVAQDVKVQVEFNPARVAAYRLIGYEGRRLRAEEFADDGVDAGEMGSGHTVTAFYEVVPAGGAGAIAPATGAMEPSRYQVTPVAVPVAALSDELLNVKVRAKLPGAEGSRRWEFPLREEGGAFAAASADFRFATAVAAFGQVLRGSPHVGELSLGTVRGWAEGARGRDAWGHRAELVELIEVAQRLRE